MHPRGFCNSIRTSNSWPTYLHLRYQSAAGKTQMSFMKLRAVAALIQGNNPDGKKESQSNDAKCKTSRNSAKNQTQESTMLQDVVSPDFQ